MYNKKKPKYQHTNAYVNSSLWVLLHHKMMSLSLCMQNQFIVACNNYTDISLHVSKYTYIWYSDMMPEIYKYIYYLYLHIVINVV